MPARDAGPSVMLARPGASPVRQFDPLIGIFNHVLDGAHPIINVAFTDDPTCVMNQIRNLTAVACDNGCAAGKRFHDHSSELLPPRRRGLTWCAQNIHGVEVAGYFGVSDACYDSDTIAVALRR